MVKGWMEQVQAVIYQYIVAITNTAYYYRGFCNIAITTVTAAAAIPTTAAAAAAATAPPPPPPTTTTTTTTTN